jgi:phosphohistidine phosphatase
MDAQRSLLLFRHGKSSWDQEFVHDHQRPLAKRGRRAAARMGQLLQRAGQIPERILCSTAVRTRQTMDIAGDAGAWQAAVEYSDRIYEAAVGQLLELVREAPDASPSLMLIGHEPGLSGVVEACTGGQVRFPTAAIARIDFAMASWREVGPGRGRLVWLLPPRFVGFLDADD